MVDQADFEERLAEVVAEIQDRINRGETPDPDAFSRLFPDFEAEIRQFLRWGELLEDVLAPARPTVPPPAEVTDLRLDLRSFPVRRRLDDVSLGTVYLLADAAETVPRELVVLRAWFNPIQRERILDSARHHAAANVPGILRILDVGRLNRVPFVVREHARGQRLDRIIARLAASDGPCPLGAILAEIAPLVTPPPASSSDCPGRADELARSAAHRRAVAGLVARLAERVQSLHHAGFLHLEISPTMIHVSPQGEATLQGIGLCWARTGIDPERMKSWPRAFVAPEITGAVRAPITWLADVYGLGMVARALFALDVSGKERPEEPASALPRALPSRLRAVIERAISVRPEKRPKTCEEFARDLERAAGCKNMRSWSTRARRGSERLVEQLARFLGR